MPCITLKPLFAPYRQKPYTSGIASTNQTRNDERISLSIVCHSRSGKATII